MSSSKQVLKSIIQSDQDEGKNTFLGAKLGLYILLVLTIIHTFWAHRDIIFKDSSWIDKTLFTSIPSTFNFSTLSLYLLKILFVVLPIIAITIWELFLTPRMSLTLMKRSEGHRYSDIWYFLFDSFLSRIPFIIAIITMGASTLDVKFNNWLYEQSNIIFSSSNLNIGPSDYFFVIASLLIYDLYKYLNHRFMHEIPFMWDFHELHHSATEMTIINDRRATPLESAFNNIILAPLLAVSTFLSASYFDVSPIAPIIGYSFYFTFSQYTLYMCHSSVKFIYPKPISYILMSPSLHWLHHSKNPNHYNCNYGAMFTFWDKLFGTYLGEEHIKDIDGFGIEGTEYNKVHPLYAVSILPIVKFSRRIRKTFFA